MTGAAGKIGLAIAPMLAAAGWNLRLTDRFAPPTVPQGCSFESGDILDADRMQALSEGAVATIHLAGRPITQNCTEAARFNVLGSATVFEAAVARGVKRIVYASSLHTLGLLSADTVFTSGLAARPDSSYGWSKVATEEMLAYLCAEHGLTGFGLRICSFRPAPRTARELTTWISPADLARLVAACLNAEGDGFTTVWGLSGNRRARIDRTVWERIGYAPADDAEDFVADLEERGVTTDLTSEFPFLGGHFVSEALATRARKTCP
jgi:uronate dehydrogenase